jgi:hypothetical protein
MVFKFAGYIGSINQKTGSLQDQIEETEAQNWKDCCQDEGEEIKKSTPYIR